MNEELKRKIWKDTIHHSMNNGSGDDNVAGVFATVEMNWLQDYIEALLQTARKEAIENGKAEYRVCKCCNGDGYTVEHGGTTEENDYPLQVGCEVCEGAGILTIEQFERYEAFVKANLNIQTDDEMPF